MNKHILQVFILTSILLLISACDCPPPENDYTWADVPVPEKDAKESYKTFLKISEINFDRSLTNFPKKEISKNPLKYKENIETAWKNSSELHNYFNKLDSYEKIADLNVNIVNNLDIYKLRDGIMLYTIYSRLKIAQRQHNEAIPPLLKINSVTRKTLPYFRGAISKLVWITTEGINLQTATILATNNSCSVEIIRKLKTPFLPLTSKELALENLAISEYLLMKNYLFEGTNALGSSKRLKVLFFLFKKNKTLRDMKKQTDVFLSCLSNSPPDFSKCTTWADNYRESPDYFNWMGWVFANTMGLESLGIIAKSLIKTKVKSDLLAIKIHEKCGETLELNDPFTGKKYFRNSETGNYSSAGPDGIYKTKDDIFL